MKSCKKLFPSYKKLSKVTKSYDELAKPFSPLELSNLNCCAFFRKPSFSYHSRNQAHKCVGHVGVCLRMSKKNVRLDGQGGRDGNGVKGRDEWREGGRE